MVVKPKRYEPVSDNSVPMTPTLKRAVQAALAAQGNMIYAGQRLDIAKFMPTPRTRDPIGRCNYQRIYKEKERAGFPHLSVADYLKMMALLEMDELEPA